MIDEKGARTSGMSMQGKGTGLDGDSVEPEDQPRLASWLWVPSTIDGLVHDLKWESKLGFGGIWCNEWMPLLQEHFNWTMKRVLPYKVYNIYVMICSFLWNAHEETRQERACGAWSKAGGGTTRCGIDAGHSGGAVPAKWQSFASFSASSTGFGLRYAVADCANKLRKLLAENDIHNELWKMEELPLKSQSIVFVTSLFLPNHEKESSLFPLLSSFRSSLCFWPFEKEKTIYKR